MMTLFNEYAIIINLKKKQPSWKVLINSFNIYITIMFNLISLNNVQTSCVNKNYVYIW